MLGLFFYGSIFIFGLCVGSFLNCVIYRLQTNEKIGKSRSHCPECGHILRWHDLIPLLSFLLLRGRCRYCGKQISVQYPAVEAATGALFLLIISNFQFPVSNFQNLAEMVYLLTISCFLIVVFVYDLKHYLILDKVIYPAIGIALAYQAINFQAGHFLNALFAACLASGFFASIVLASREKWMGTGDVKLAFLMGLLLGFPQILTGLFFAFLFGAIIGVGMIILKKKTLKSEVPFGPFLVTGTFTAMLWGEQILNWYFGFL